MTSVEDFTLFQRGAEVALEGRVDICAQCGRNGISHDGSDGVTYVIHVQVSRVLGDGMLTEPRDYCVVTALAPEDGSGVASSSAAPRGKIASA